MTIYARRYFPGREIDAECLAEAAFLEWDYWEKMKALLGG